MNYITALLMIGTFLIFTACSGGDSDEPISEEYLRNKNRLLKIDQDNHEPKAVEAVEDDIQTVLDDNNFNNPYSDPESDPYSHPNSDPYSDPNK